MIDIESKIVDTVFNAVNAIYPNANVTTGFDETTATFPSVVIEEVENVPVRRFDTDDCAENYSRISYEISIYTNNVNSAKSDGKTIFAAVDEALQGLKFRRIRKNKPLNINRTIFRQYGRWEVIVGKPIINGDEVIYQMYRR